eukprot:TRINITY_DN9628_c0_g1_i9.p1 TRINITY_DN9628_c0_g1~~TRINITY_DN9628_c0_g1_i9.p1  ORF type:complete len:406 (+),score=70.88 TRINITY_DN9628_c0_g1_i9:132-1349(+)
MDMSNPAERLTIFSGGTAFNDAAKILADNHTSVTYCLPISDDGGSSAEILRHLGGPAIGDLRSRLLRLAQTGTEEQQAVLDLLQFRLPKNDADDARKTWMSIIEGVHPLWQPVTEAYKHIIRSFLLHFNTRLLQSTSVRAHTHQGEEQRPFDFCGASVGNCFFTGARLFFHSIRSAVLLWKSVAGVPADTHVLPVINCSHSVNLGCELQNGTKILGQNNISHPGEQVQKDPHLHDALPSPIQRLFYINDWQQQIEQRVDSEVITDLHASKTIVYAMGSLFTSIGACLLPKGLGACIAEHTGRKVLLLNSCSDRETTGMTALDHVKAIVNICQQDCYRPFPESAFITDMIFPEKTTVELDLERLRSAGIKCHAVACEDGTPNYELNLLVERILILHEETSNQISNS